MTNHTLGTRSTDGTWADLRSPEVREKLEEAGIHVAVRSMDRPERQTVRAPRGLRAFFDRLRSR